MQIAQWTKCEVECLFGILWGILPCFNIHSDECLMQLNVATAARTWLVWKDNWNRWTIIGHLRTHDFDHFTTYSERRKHCITYGRLPGQKEAMTLYSWPEQLDWNPELIFGLFRGWAQSLRFVKWKALCSCVFLFTVSFRTSIQVVTSVLDSRHVVGVRSQWLSARAFMTCGILETLSVKAFTTERWANCRALVLWLHRRIHQ